MNLAHIIDDHDADRVAIISRGRATTYGSLRDQVAHVRGGLAGLGVGPGHRVGLLCGNGRYFVVSYLATIGLGAVAVPLNPTSPTPEIERELATVGAAAVVVEPAAIQAWSGVDRAKVPTIRSVIVTEGGESLDGAVSLATLLAAEPVPVTEVEPDHLAVLMFTSGTAGSPRAAMLSHGNLQANLDQGRSDGAQISAGDVVYGVLPMYHIFGLNVVLGLTLARGATVVLVQRFDPSTALDTIRERGVTVVPGAPPLWLAFSHFDDAPADSFANVRLALTGAAKMPEEAMRRLKQQFGLELREGYGLTEAAPVVTSSTGVVVKPGSVGRVLDGIEVRLVDESGDDVVAGDPGEIWVKGPNVFQGYWNDAEATRACIDEDGWLHTGDIAMVDDEGFLFLVDRAKDLIIVSGFNVFPAEVEEVLLQHPAVEGVAVVGVPHPHTGESVKAYVKARDGVPIEEDDVIDFCAARLPHYKCPNKVWFVEDIPRGLGGKVIRRLLG